MNVADLELIYQIDLLEDDKRIEASMMLSKQFSRRVKALLLMKFKLHAFTLKEYQINVNLTFEPSL